MNILSFVNNAGIPALKFAAGFFPGLAPAVSIIEKIAIGAPIAMKLIEQGKPIYNAIVTAGPEMLPNIKALYAVAFGGVAKGASPKAIAAAAERVSDEDALRFAGPVFLGRAWTREEEERWFDIAKGDVSNA